MTESERDAEEQDPTEAPELIEAERDLRRRELLLRYQEDYRCRFIALIGDITPDSPLYVEEILRHRERNAGLHLLLRTDGGNGEVAVRLARQIQSACRALTILVPDEAKSAGTLLALGAHRILMGPTSDLGPIDPQMWLANYGYVPAKSIAAAFREAERAAQSADSVAWFHAQALANRSAIEAQLAREAVEHTSVQLRQALQSKPNRARQQVEQLESRLRSLLITEPQSHAATISAQELRDAGLPVTELNSSDQHWLRIWELWTHYFEMPESQVYESVDASYRFDLE